MTEEQWFRDIDLIVFDEDFRVLEREICMHEDPQVIEEHALDIRRKYAAAFEEPVDDDMPPTIAFWRDYFHTQFDGRIERQVQRELWEERREFLYLMGISSG